MQTIRKYKEKRKNTYAKRLPLNVPYRVRSIIFIRKAYFALGLILGQSDRKDERSGTLSSEGARATRESTGRHAWTKGRLAEACAMCIQQIYHRHPISIVRGANNTRSRPAMTPRHEVRRRAFAFLGSISLSAEEKSRHSLGISGYEQSWDQFQRPGNIGGDAQTISPLRLNITHELRAEA